VHARTGYLPGDLRLWPRLTTREVARALRSNGVKGSNEALSALARKISAELAGAAGRRTGTRGL
jgi:hypothetical protein